MKKLRTLIVFGALALTHSAWAEEPDPRVWTLSENEGKHILSFSQPETDDVMVVMSCQGGSVDVFVAASSEKVKPGETVDFTFTVGKAKASLRGGASVNELDGIPSLNAGIGIADPFFAGLAGAKKTDSFSITVRGDTQSASMASLGKKGRDFAAKCKPQS